MKPHHHKQRDGADTIRESIERVNEEIAPPNYGPMVLNEGNDYVQPTNPFEVAATIQPDSPVVAIEENSGVIIDPADGTTQKPASTLIPDDVGTTYIQIEPVSNEVTVPDSGTIFSSPESIFPGDQAVPEDGNIILAQNDIYAEQPAPNDLFSVTYPVVEDNTQSLITEQPAIPVTDVYAQPETPVIQNNEFTTVEAPSVPVVDVFATTPNVGTEAGNWGIQSGEEQPSIPVVDIFANTPTIGAEGGDQSAVPVQDIFASTPYIDTGTPANESPNPEVQSVFHVDTVTPSNDVTPPPPDTTWTESTSNNGPSDSWTSGMGDNSQTTPSSDNSMSI